MPAAEPERRSADRLLVQVIRRGGPWVPVLAATTTLTALAEVLLPAALGYTLDAVLAGRATAGWVSACAALIAISVAGEAFGELAGGMSRARATAWLRHALLRHILAAGTGTTRRFAPGDLVSRVVANTDDAGNAAAAAAMAATSALPAVGSLVALTLIDPWLAATFLVGITLLTLMLRGFVREASQVTARYQRTQGDIAARLLGALVGARTIAAAGTESREARRVLAPLPDLHEHGMAMWRTQTRMTLKGEVVVPLLEVAVLAAAGLLLAAERLTLGELLAAGRYAVLGSGLSAVVLFANRVVRGRAAAGRAAEVLAVPSTPYGTRELPPGPGRLELRQVTVRGEDGAPLLDSVDLAVPGGSAVAVVGRSGAGKSLFAALAGRLADPDEGTVVLDGVPLPELDRRALRRAIGYAAERPVLIGETVGEAIAYGVDEPDREGVRAASRAASADTFVRRLPDGYETARRAAPMSGGETQRIGLARAFAHADRLLVLDDATSSLDTATELEVSRALTERLGDRTRVIVAHRAATAARADRVAWIDGGRLRAYGPHDELWRDPAYRAVFLAEECAAERGPGGEPEESERSEKSQQPEEPEVAADAEEVAAP